MRPSTWILPFILILALAACGPQTGTDSPPAPAPADEGQMPTSTPQPAAGSDATTTQAASTALGQPYDPGNPAYTDLWVNPQSGDDNADGRTPASALRSLDAAWRLIPMGTPLETGYRIRLLPGEYPEVDIPTYWESRYGSYDAPVLLQGQGNEAGEVILRGFVNIFDSRYIYFENLSILTPGDAFHCELCDHLLIRNVIMSAEAAWEVVKINQSQHVYIESSDFGGADDNTIDFVAVQYGHILNSHIHDAGDWCAYAKGGSAYLHIAGNEIYNCGTGGFTAGQGTGFQFMTAPWIQYEAYDLKVYGNIIHDTEGAGLGVNGGYNILLAHNTLYRVGSRSHALEVVFGMRSCDGQAGDAGRERCQQYLDLGGWGTTAVDDGSNHVHIGNKNVYIYNNLLYNPPGFRSEYQHFAIYAPRENPAASGLPLAVTDANLQIRGNVIWNGDSALPLGVEDGEGCAAANPTCNASQLLADNTINTLEPQFVDVSSLDFHPAGGWFASLSALPIPDFDWDVSGIPAGNVSNALPGLPGIPGARGAE